MVTGILSFIWGVYVSARPLVGLLLGSIVVLNILTVVVRCMYFSWKGDDWINRGEAFVLVKFLLPKDWRTKKFFVDVIVYEAILLGVVFGVLGTFLWPLTVGLVVFLIGVGIRKILKFQAIKKNTKDERITEKKKELRKIIDHLEK